MSDKTTEQQLADILRVLQGDELAKVPGLVSEVRDILKRYSKTERVLAKLTSLVSDQNKELLKLRDNDRERELEVAELKTRQRLMWKIITGGLTGATAIAGTAGTVAGILTGG